ncbi:MAG: hypothetical protein PSN04_07545 [Methyloprofundus sp.]|nr:hypothetical protein [Methyloprofundus sp.]
MLVWKGWGLLALLIPVALNILMQFGIDYFLGAGFYKAATWSLPLAFSLSSIPVFLVGYQLNKKPARTLVDIETHEIVELKTIHSFFWIPLQYWSAILLVVSLWVYLANIGIIYQ